MDEMARRADDVARRKPDKERIEETVFNFGVFVQRTHPHVRMTGKMIQPKIAKTNRTISDPLFKIGSPLKCSLDFSSHLAATDGY